MADGYLSWLGVPDKSSVFKYIDTTDTWNSTIDLIDDCISIAISMEVEFPDELMQTQLISKDNSRNPYYERLLLTIEYEEITSVPLPGAAWLFGSGLFGVSG